MLGESHHSTTVAGAVLASGRRDVQLCPWLCHKCRYVACCGIHHLCRHMRTRPNCVCLAGCHGLPNSFLAKSPAFTPDRVCHTSSRSAFPAISAFVLRRCSPWVRVVLQGYTRSAHFRLSLEDGFCGVLKLCIPGLRMALEKAQPLVEKKLTRRGERVFA